MEQLRQIGEALGSLKTLMVFRDEIRINQRQCCLLVDAFNLAFESVAEEIKRNLKFDERSSKWKPLERPLKELHRVFKEGEQYIRQCMEIKDWWAKAISLNQNTDAVEIHLHNLLWCVPVVLEAVESAGELSGCDLDEIQKRRLISSKKYEREWMDFKLFQHKFGRQYLISQDFCSRMDYVAKEDRWILLDMIAEKKSSPGSKQESRLCELLTAAAGGGSKEKLFPSSILVGSKDYQVKRRLGNGSHYKEIQWMGESFAVRHFFGDIEPLVAEITLLSKLTHPNVMHFMCAFSDEEKKECFLVMELMHKSLCNYIKETCGPRSKKVPFTLPVAVDVMLQIARGMEYLHSHKIYHGNLNPSTILVKAGNYSSSSSPSSSEGYLHVKVSGIGLVSVKNFKNSSTNQTASTNPCIWFAPEVLLEQEQTGGSCDSSRYTEKADVYSFAMICFELLTGKVPFEDGHLQGDKTSRNIRAGERPLFPFPSPKYLTGLTKRCWQTDPSLRPNFSSICRVLRYVKRHLVMNPDHSQPDPPAPPLDYFDLETSLCRRFPAWAGMERVSVSQVPFQMFAYRVVEREKTSANQLKEKSSESGSEGASSVCGDENAFQTALLQEHPFCSAAAGGGAAPVVISKSPPPCGGGFEPLKKVSVKKAANGKAGKQQGQQQQQQQPKGRTTRPPPQQPQQQQPITPHGPNLRMNSESQLYPKVMNPGRRRTSGHASDSELS